MRDGDVRYVVKPKDGIFWVAEQTYDGEYDEWHTSSKPRPFESRDAARAYCRHLVEEHLGRRT